MKIDGGYFKIMMLDEMLQNYFEFLYHPHQTQIKNAFFGQANEIYGELYYYSMKKLLGYLSLSETDHFLDIGSGLGKIVFQSFLTQPIASATGIEIHPKRHDIALSVSQHLKSDLPRLFENRLLSIRQGDFLAQDFSEITTVYTCSTVFSWDFLIKIGEKINELPKVRQITTIRKIPNLSNFKLEKKIYLHGTWDYTGCYLYKRVSKK